MNEENKKTCNGYEAMYTFLSDEDFSEHLKVCEECAKEHAKMQRVSDLIQEAKPYIKEKQKRRTILKSAAAVFVQTNKTKTLNRRSTLKYGKILINIRRKEF